MIEIFKGGVILNIIFLILALMGILISIFYGHKVKKLVYNIKSQNLIHAYNNLIPEVTLLYKNANVPNLTLSQVALWNIGSEVINKSDTASLEPIQILISGECRFLEAAISFRTNATNDFSLNISKDRQCISLDFEFIEKNDGIVISILHTGMSSSDLIIKGKIKGTKNIEDYSFLSRYNKGAIAYKLLLLRLGETKSNLWGFVLRVILFPVFIFLIYIGNVIPDKTKYFIVRKEFLLG